ncbi:MAG TPA: hypothetical protein VEY67_00105 [Candidatus Dormibacteraeota bacterium]|nr:hypothetical protein [Candidatus Dormibacteraeota bacterium]
MSVLVGLEGDLVRTLQSVKKGIAMLDQRRAEYGAGPDEAPGEDEAGEEEDAGEPAVR